MYNLYKSAEKITRYEFVNGNDIGDFYIDIIDKEEWYEAWLVGRKYGVESMMFGGCKKSMTKKEFIRTVEANLDYEIALYIDEYYVDCEEEEPRVYEVKRDSVYDLAYYNLKPGKRFTFKEFCKFCINQGENTNALFHVLKEVEP